MANEPIARLICWVTANEARIEQRFLCRRIEGADHPLLAGTRPNRRRKPCAGQLLEPLLGLFDLCTVLIVEDMSGVAGTIHHDLACHFTHSEFAWLRQVWQARELFDVPARIPGPCLS
jgi:hypothetical protein